LPAGRYGRDVAAGAQDIECGGGETRSRKAAATGRQFAVCVDNHGYEASLERNKIYVVLSDKNAESDTDIRVVDESGGDYLSLPVVSSPSRFPQPLRRRS
jgi:hypothetical protein